ncbi:response regulator transcription factor [Anaerocaecibacter muris]|uniref:response regulator transcription factor n=1 Tax=Anaerocaecibacter muris TaxID=2941513 RepID=UPI00203ED1A8|nr:response regulator transcription factor [Anaerocaecibacter muris]
MTLKKIFIVDDDVYIGDMLEEILTKEGYSVSRAYSGTEAALLLSVNKPDLVLLDLMLPGLSGEKVLEKIKDIPVIVVSAKIDVNDKVNLLLGGAADYITKPFDTKELLARITVQLRDKKSERTIAPTVEYDDIVLDTTARRVTVNNREVHLTRTEYAILKILMQRSAQVVTKSELMDGICEDTPDCTDNSLKIHIANLRKKLKSITDKDYIDSVWGIGFKLKAD